MGGMMKTGITEPLTAQWPLLWWCPRKTAQGGTSAWTTDQSIKSKDSYPLQRIDKPLDLVAGSSSFSTLDLPSGYWQVQLSPEYRPKTGGLWQFRVLSNSSTTFESLMDSVLAGVLSQRFLVYLDERLVHGSIFGAALDALRQLMERVTAAGLKLHPDKCHIVRREVETLGHKLHH